MFDQVALARWLDARLTPALDAADGMRSLWASSSLARAPQGRQEVDLLRHFVEEGCAECPLGYRDGTVDALLLHLMIVLDSRYHTRLRRLRQQLRRLALQGLVPDRLAERAPAPLYAQRRMPQGGRASADV